jgi:hypothetical protein
VGEQDVRPAHPLFVDAVRHALGGPELRRLRTEVVDRMATDRPIGVVERLQFGVLALESDRPQPVADLITAAEEALRLGDLELSERFGRAAVNRGGGLAARLPLAYALAWQGRGCDGIKSVGARGFSPRAQVDAVRSRAGGGPGMDQGSAA